MYYKKISVPVFIFIMSFLFLQSCSDDIVSPDMKHISGVLTDTSGKLLSGVKVKSGDKTAVTDEHGSYILWDVQPPYDIVIIDEPTKSQVLIKSVTTQRIFVPDLLSYTNTDIRTDLRITIPPEIFQPGVKGKAIFTNRKDKTFSTDITGHNTILQVSVRDYEWLFGRLIVIMYKTDNAGNILSYENFYATLDLLVLPGEDQHFDIYAGQLSYNPDERNVTGNINIPSGYTAGEQYFYLSFTANTPIQRSGESKFSLIDGNNFNIVIPVELPTQFSVLINNSIVSADNRKSGRETFKLPENINSIVLSAKASPELTSPANNSTGITPNTLISFTEGDGEGIYVTRFKKGDYNCSVISESNSFHFSDISQFEIGFIKDSDFEWSVDKYGGFSDLKEFLWYYSGTSGRFISSSEKRTFRSAH